MAESLADTLNALSIGAPKKLVIVDALNYLSCFAPIDEAARAGVNATTLFSEMVSRVAAFKAAAARTNIDLIFVVDNGQSTEEAKAKWLQRRKAEVETQRRAMPAGTEVVYEALLQSAGFVMLYPPDIDGDDAVALLAHHYGGSILSRDRDMLRYAEIDRGRIFKAGDTSAACMFRSDSRNTFSA